MEQTEIDIQKPFYEFAGSNGTYYTDVFLKIQKSILPAHHVNVAALLGSFIWAALRGNWLLFVISFIIDMITAINLALIYKYKMAAIFYADKEFLVIRYEGWADNHLIAAIFAFVVGRMLFSWLADRLYVLQYDKWRAGQNVNHGVKAARLVIVAVVFTLIVPLLIYRSTQFAPEERTCIKQDRAMALGEEIKLKDRFDCFVIGEFPTLFWIDRPDEISYPRGDDGQRIVQRTAAAPDALPVNLNVFVAQFIDDGIAYVTIFYGFIFDSITVFLRAMLNVITSVFVGTPWPITMGVLVFIAYHLAGIRITIFVTACILYLALFGFWQTAMDTMSLVVASSLICVFFGLPLGIWVGKSKRGQALMTPILDIMQTIPSFVYLLPAIAFFSIGKPPGILATVIFAMPPMVRLVALGVRHVPENTKEAAIAFGANPRQLLFKVELPLALPSIMAGINQVIMMSLSMVVVAALIGAGGMGYLVTEALQNTETGRGVLAGIGIALLAMMIDRVVQKVNMIRR